MREIMEDPRALSRSALTGEKQKQELVLCSTHQDSCKLFCTTCQEAICFKCNFYFHQSHEIKEVLLNGSPNEAESGPGLVNTSPAEAESVKKPIENGLPMEQLSVGDSFRSEDAGKEMEKVRVLHVESPASIFVREDGEEEKYFQMRDVLRKVSASASSGNSHCEEIKVNSSVICYLAAGARWERGLVMSEDSHSGTLTVRLADIGKLVTIARSEVRQMGEELEKFGNMIQCVALTDIEPAGAASTRHGWSLESIFVLRELLEQQMIQMRRLEDGEKAVKLFVEKITIVSPLEPLRKSLVSVSTLLVKKGLAHKKATSERCFNLGKEESNPKSVVTKSLAQLEFKMRTKQSGSSDGSMSLASLNRVVEEEAEGEPEEGEESNSDSDSASYLSSSLSPPSPSQIRRLLEEPVVPSSSFFRAKLTHIDSKGTVWVVPKDTSKIEEEVRSLIKVSIKPQPKHESQVGDIVVMRKNLCRGRIIHLWSYGETVTLLDIDSGKKHTVNWSLLSLPAKSLVDLPPLAIPVKLYGIKKSLAELPDLNDLHYDEVIVINHALNHQRFPLPVNIRFADNNNNAFDGNLALVLLQKGFFQLIKKQVDWSREFFDHGLDKALDPKEKYVMESEGKQNYWSIVTEGPKECELLNMKSPLPHPLPLSVGQWLGVGVEGLMTDLKDGIECQPSVGTKYSSQVWCSLRPITAPGLEEEAAASDSIINSGLNILQKEFEEFEEDLMFKVISAARLDKVYIGKEILARYQNEGNDSWNRAVINHIKKDGVLVVSYTDYGYRGDVTRDNVRAITELQGIELCHVVELHFKMPEGNQELQEMREILLNANEVMARVEEIKISEEGEQIQVSFWELKGKGADRTYAQIC